ncbi:DUF6080 domain-containing protein [Saccharibacillus sp. CPCC 101409]|uniref:DUF6080 domain-containing protein n=1 Tax=Saccharibacillus sp. CPCC 101409 TaxID=3058041 RepID=UPI002671330A|nr:DUF6080 domain-containing protein [Saccharibacillus sp. CPCC 101409]MDO3411181.1 DUF6080 domain-containing protein [Saccharibacillus sp. CPCC 101409]
MSFRSYLFANRRINTAASLLVLVLALFYIGLNAPYIRYMAGNAETLRAHTPFATPEFTLNLFNFDPSMYYGIGTSSVIHPLMSLLAVPLGAAARNLGGNLFFLVLQSLVNGASAALVLIVLSRKTDKLLLPLLVAALFGTSSYLIFTALIPDSYPYVQFAIVLSVVYMQYARAREADGEKERSWPFAALAAVHFALTSTNVIPFGAALLMNMRVRRGRERILRYVRIVLLALGFVAIGTAVQFLCFGQAWIEGWSSSLKAGGTGYSAAFKLSVHYPVFYMLGVNPILAPHVHLLDPGMAAFVTDLTRPYPLHVRLTGGFLLLLSVAGFLRGIRERETWTLGAYIAFAAALHLGAGFGLKVFTYDMYLYAGHYLFAIFLLGGAFAIGLREGLFKKALTAVLLAALLTTIANNVYRHAETLRTIDGAYEEMGESAESTGSMGSAQSFSALNGRA